MLCKRLLPVFALLFVVSLTAAQSENSKNKTPTTKKGKSRFDVKMTDEQEAAVPTVAGGMPVLSGTSWAVVSIYEKGTTPKTQHRPGNFLFCKNGKWEHQTGSTFLGGQYKVSGATLSTKDEGAGGKWEVWKLRWDGPVKELEMEQGNLVFVLRYQGKTQC